MATQRERPIPANNYPDQDCCPECGTDWKRGHPEYCSQYRQCLYPPGCTEDAKFHPNLCPEHFAALSAFCAPA